MTRVKVCVIVSILTCIMVPEVLSMNFACSLMDNFDASENIFLALFVGNDMYTISTDLTQRDRETIKFIDSTKSSILYIHGFMESRESDTVQTIVSAYLARGDVNILVLDWSTIAKNLNYYYVSKQVPNVGKAAANLLENLSDRIDLRSLHIVGHSLGAHVASYIGRSLGVTLKRITGLDPAFPLFYPSQCHLKPDDAEVVCVLHTNGGVYGTPVNTGTIDFYANMGIGIQPGCGLFIGSFCSHQKSVEYYAQSIINPRVFPASKCIILIDENREDNEMVYFNDATPADSYGSYCFTTNESSPYGMYS